MGLEVRRHHDDWMKRKAVWLARESFLSDDEFRADMISQYRKKADHLRSFSCWMCGNPRKFFGECTRQELLIEFELNRQT